MSDFEKIGAEIGRLVAEKNQAYGDSFARSGEILEILYPDGVDPEDYPDMLAITRVIDKLFRVAAQKHAFDESPWRDVAGYGILGAAMDETHEADFWATVQDNTDALRWIAADEAVASEATQLGEALKAAAKQEGKVQDFIKGRRP